MTRPWPLRTRLMLLIVLLLLPLQLVVLGSYARAHAERRAVAVDNAVLLAENVAAAIEAFVRDIESTSIAMTAALSSTPLDQPNAGTYLQRVITGYPVLRSIFVTDLEGKVVSTSATGVGTDLASRPYIVALKSGADPVWSGSLTGLQSGEVTVAFGRTIPDASGLRRGFLIFAFYPDRLVSSLGLRIPDDADLALIDQAGLILTQTGSQELPADRRDASTVPEVRAAYQRNQTVRVDATSTAFGAQRYGAVVPISGNGWLLALTRPLGPLDAALNERFAVDVLAVGGVIALAAFIAAYVARGLTRPISRMSLAAAAIARGERPVIPAVHEDDVEVAQLGTAMTTMSTSIAKREDALRLLATASDVLSRSLDYDETLTSLARVVVPDMADWCVVDVVDPAGLKRVSVVQADPAMQALADEIFRSPVDYGRSPVPRVIASGEPLLMGDLADPSALRDLSEQEVRIYREMRPRSLLIVPLLIQGRPLGAITFVSAESARHYTDDDLVLAREIARRAAVAIEHARTYRELQESIRARDEFLSSAAHELKTPLTSIKGYAQTVERRTRDLDPSIRDRFVGLNRIDAATSRMARTIDEFLDLARLRLGQTLELDRASVDLVAIAREQVADHAAMASGHQIRLDLRQESLVGPWDGRRLQHVVSNLISNAVKFSPNGGDVTVTIAKDSDYAVLAVADQGVGIPPEERAAIFERFRRGTNVKGIPGTGIGLTLARQIVELHGGGIDIESEPGVGSTVTVRLPLADHSSS